MVTAGAGFCQQGYSPGVSPLIMPVAIGPAACTPAINCIPASVDNNVGSVVTATKIIDLILLVVLLLHRMIYIKLIQSQHLTIIWKGTGGSPLIGM